MPTTMHRARSFRFLLAFAALAFNPLVTAGVKGTGGGVTTGVGNPDPTAPSTDVQSQSAGFVQQNQQSANAGAAGSVLPMGSSDPQSGTKGQTPTVPGSPNAGGDAAAKGADGKPVAPGAPGAAGAAAAAAPPQPAGPPPEYVSVMRHLNPAGDKAQGSETVVETPLRADSEKPPAEPPAAAPAAPPKPATPSAPRPNRAIADADKHPVAERPATPPPATGGRGAAPDDYTFYIGLILAGGLLAFAASIYLRTGGGNATPS